MQSLARADLECLARSGLCAEDCGDVVEFPGLDVVVGRVHAVDISLDYVAVVADDEAMVKLVGGKVLSPRDMVSCREEF